MANETITGKIFQLKDPSNSYNRFPRTVMEAVYGLNTYLQNQFSALADIYMPIEGITESKPLQEFVYRACPSSIKAKSLTLDRIYGKTLAWNQLTNYHADNAGWAVEVPSLKNLINGIPSGHKVFVCAYCKIKAINGTPSSAYYGFGVAGLSVQAKNQYANIQVGENGYISRVFSRSADATQFYVYGCGNDQVGVVGAAYVDIMISDLTLLYGSAIDGMTDAQILAKFESEFPGYHSYEPGKLISNDAESIETVGFNQWDEEWEVGVFDSAGNPVSHNNYIRTKNFCLIIPGATYYLKGNSYYSDFEISYYDENKNLVVSNTRIDYASVFVVPSGVTYFRFYTYKSDGIYNHDICINLSDPAKNGTYEPYRKSTMQLGLNSFKVKSHNIWDEEWEEGYIDISTGQNGDTNATFRSKNYIPIISGNSYYANQSYGSMYILCYDSNKNYLGINGARYMSGLLDDYILPSTAYIRFYFEPIAGTTTYNNDICINISSSFNGQYEPHGIITIEGGLKSAGSVYDEIVGNKYIKRAIRVDLGSLDWIYNLSGARHEFAASVSNGKFGSGIVNPNAICSLYQISVNQSYPNYGDMVMSYADRGYNQNTVKVICKNSAFSDAATFKAAMSGVMLYYELATPIEYELVSPLVPTVKAGTTEARISPNSDGLSAPMVADMTYDAQANNDSASAQYALTAGRLLNSHKLWGQDFDGTQDVSGALTGVTNLNSLLYFGSNNVGIGQPNPQYKLDVNGTARVTGNTTIGGTLGVTGALTANGAVSINNTLTVGTAQTNRATTLNGTLSVSGNSTLDGTVKIGGSSGATLSWVSGNSGLNINKGLYSDSYITAGAASASSDISLKTNVLSISADSAKSVMMALRPCEWDWNENSKLDGHCAGLVAQQVSPVIPYVVEKHGEYLSLNYNALHAFEIALAQNHETRIKALEKENAELKAKVEQLKMR